MKIWKKVFLKRLLCLLIVYAAAGTMLQANRIGKHPKKTNQPEKSKFNVTSPVMSRGYYPCSDCHNDIEVNRKKRQLKEEHQDIVIKHDEKNRWCLDCHSASNRDRLHLVNGTLITFEESYRLCGQCHGPKLRDWKHGAHGKRTGNWNGKKQYYLCVHCHDPHYPLFKKIKPLPPPNKYRAQNMEKGEDEGHEKKE